MWLPRTPLIMLAGLLLTAANMIPLTDESMLEFTRSLQSSNKPAFLMYVPEDCQTEACKMMLMFWQMAGTEMPGLVWLVDCNEASTQVLSLGSNSVHSPSLAVLALTDHAPSQELCEVARGQIAGGLAIEHGPQIMNWEEEGWKPYRGPRKPEGLLEVMRAAYLAYGLAQGGGEQAAAGVEAETASFEKLVKQLEADGPPDAREMAELAAYGMAKENAATKELVSPTPTPTPTPNPDPNPSPNPNPHPNPDPNLPDGPVTPAGCDASGAELRDERGPGAAPLLPILAARLRGLRPPVGGGRPAPG